MAGDKITGSPRMVSTFIEEALRLLGFVLIHDGSTSGSAFFTRKYQLKLSGEFVNTFVTLRYDLRDNWADMSIGWKELGEIEHMVRRNNPEPMPAKNVSAELKW